LSLYYLDIMDVEDYRATARAYFLSLAVFAVLLFLVGLGRRDLWGSDEPRVAGIGAEMARSGEILVPRLNGEPFLEKPPLYFWISAASFHLLGENTYAARLPSALAAIGGVILIFFLCRNMGFPPMSAFLSGMMLATSGEYWAIGRRCILDMLLCFSVLGAMLCFYNAAVRFREKERVEAGFLWSGGFVFFLSCAVMTKGLIGLVVPASALLFWLTSRLVVNREFCVKSWAVLLIGSVLCLVPAGIWVLLLYKKQGWGAVYDVVWLNNFGRFTGEHPGHKAPFYFYLPKFPAQFLPWTILVPLGLVYHYKRIRKGDSNSLFMLCWLVPPFVLLSAASGKRPLYLLPLYPAAALFVAAATGSIIEERRGSTGFRVLRLCQTAALLLLVGFLVADTVVLPMRNRKESYEPLFEYYRKIDNGGKEVALYKPSERIRGAAVFYMKKKVPVIRDAEELMGFLGSRHRLALSRAGSVEGVRGLEITRSFQIDHRRWVFVKLDR